MLQHAFVVMSFGQDDRTIFDNGIKPAIESLGIEAVRVDGDHFTGTVTEQIVDRIKGAYFVVAEMSRQRPNCYYEVGFAQALGRPVILLIDNPANIHFDVQGFPFVVYEGAVDLQGKLRERIIGSVLSQHGEPPAGDIRFGKFSGCAFANGRLLTARVRMAKRKYSELDVHVTATPGSKPLRGSVRFYLHNTYKPATCEVEVKDGIAALDLTVEGLYTIGAKADNDKTALELNLFHIPGTIRQTSAVRPDATTVGMYDRIRDYAGRTIPWLAS
jgi:hypothetical protein